MLFRSSLEGRTGIPGEKLSRDNKVFTYSAYYIAQMLFNVYMAVGNDANFYIYPIAIVKGYMRLFLLNENVLLCGFLGWKK